ncbi:MAG: glycosyltransferase [Planctomycetota bacterium]|nr:glycosyltransferase [Planctomycetota bacterium]MDG1985492.1 glycosyltransferase [Planctomycetota bacterium]
MKTRPRISLCMIAKNEEALIAGCLRSVRGVAHEVIVVDTGSTDRTVAIAEAEGARVVHFRWCDDFAKARNAGVELATGTHILILDADERLAPNMGESLLEAARSPQLLLGCLPLYNAKEVDADPAEVMSGAKQLGALAFVPRLFKNLPEMRFSRRVHETLTDGFNQLHARGLGATATVGAALIHYGDAPSHRTKLERDQRNTRLLRLCLEDDPGDGEIAGHLVVQLIKDGAHDEARAVGERHFSPFVERNASRPAGHFAGNMVRIGYALGLLQTEAGDHTQALATITDALRFTPEQHPNLSYVQGLAQTGLGDLAGAQRSFEKVLAADGRHFAQPVLPSITNELSRLKISGLHLARGDYDSARAALPQAEGPWSFARSLLAAEIEVEAGSPELAMAILAPFVDLDGLAPDWYVLVHRALTALGDDTGNLLGIASNASPGAWLERRRAVIPA